MSGLIKSVVEGIGQDLLTDKANEYAESHFQPTKNPFYETINLPNGETKEIKRKLPKDLFNKKESKAWKSIQNKAWMHDRSLCGCCCWTDTIGWAPLLALLPVIGPAIMYSIHNKLIVLADKEFNLPMELKAKMHGNIIVDLCISLVPILGTLFSWLHTCSTRNAAMVYNYIVQRAIEEKQTNLKRAQVLQQRQQQQMEKMKQNSNNNSNSRTNIRNNTGNNNNSNNNSRTHIRNNNSNYKENYEMNHLNNNSKTSITAPQQARYRPTPQSNQQRYNQPPPQQRYNRPPVAAPQQQTRRNNEYYEPKQHNLPYPIEDTEFY